MERARDQRPILLGIVAAPEATIGQKRLGQLRWTLHFTENFEGAAESSVSFGPVAHRF